MCSPANTVTGRRHATTVTGQCDLVVRDAVGMSNCAAPIGEVTGDGLETSGRVLVGVPYPGVSEESHKNLGVAGVWADRMQLCCTGLLLCYLTLGT